MRQSGVLNLNKAAGITSFAAVRRLRELTGIKRVGHAGTLDPLATGVLPLLLGSATRLAGYALMLPKTYIADVHLGFRTATDDAEAEREAIADPSSIDAARLEAALAKFRGRIMQTPPAYSAVKVEGERSYRLARRGEMTQLSARPVEVHSVEMLGFHPGPQATARVRVVCGSGTYLRSLARDLGDRLEVGGYLGSLVRSAYGNLRLEDAVRLQDLDCAQAVEAAMLPLEAILPDMQAVQLTIEQVAQVRQGRPVRVLPEPIPGAVRAHDPNGRLVALGHTDALRRTFVPEKVLN